jgi:SAM-dependent methyltransferase
MLVLTNATLATVDELFRYKSEGFRLDDFPGYTTDQWGIKAHNRPWIEEAGQFARGQRIIEVGGGYSLLPKYLAEKYELEAWVGDDFGMSSGEPIWSRWGNPHDYASERTSVKYAFERFGTYSAKYPDRYFDRIFTVSTLEHIPADSRLAVLQDIHRCLKPGGRQLHTIDIACMSPRKCIQAAVATRVAANWPLWGERLRKRLPIGRWIEAIRASGVKIAAPIPSPLQLLDRKVLVESPDVVYRFYPPNDTPKAYWPSASLLLVIDDE